MEKQGTRLIQKGDIYWLVGPIEAEQGNLVSHPHVVLQDTALNMSRIDSIVVCGVSTNMKRAYEVGNVLLEIDEGGLTKQSFVAVGQVSIVKKDQLKEKIGSLTNERVAEILQGIGQRANEANRQL